MKYWYLEGKIPKQTDDLLFWGKSMEGSRRVAADEIGGVRVSTVFLGLDHSWGGGPPILFETMIFGGEYDQYQDRCSTWEQAEEMHRKAVELVREEEEFQKREKEFEAKFGGLSKSNI